MYDEKKNIVYIVQNVSEVVAGLHVKLQTHF